MNKVLLTAVMALASCAGPLARTGAYMMEATLEKAVKGAVQESLDPLSKRLDILAANQRFLLQSVATEQSEMESFRKVVYGSMMESGKLHNKWERKIALLKQKIGDKK